MNPPQPSPDQIRLLETARQEQRARFTSKLFRSQMFFGSLAVFFYFAHDTINFFLFDRYGFPHSACLDDLREYISWSGGQFRLLCEGTPKPWDLVLDTLAGATILCGIVLLVLVTTPAWKKKNSR